MFNLKVLSREVTEDVLKMPEVIDTVREVYQLKQKETPLFFLWYFTNLNRGLPTWTSNPAGLRAATSLA